MPGLEDPERAVAAQARLERLQRACGGLLKPEARFTDLSDAHMGAAQQTHYDLTLQDSVCAYAAKCSQGSSPARRSMVIALKLQMGAAIVAGKIRTNGEHSPLVQSGSCG